MRTIMLAVLAAATVHSAALAAAPKLWQYSGVNTYYNKPGKHPDDLLNEARECVSIINNVGITFPTERYNVYKQPGLLTILSAISSGGAISYSEIENCMVVRGWRVISIPNSEYNDIEKLASSAQAKLMSDWIGSDQPHGQVLRVWSNEATSTSTDRIPIGYPSSAKPPIGLTAFSIATEPSKDSAPKPDEKADLPRLEINRAGPFGHLSPKSLFSPSGQNGVILASAHGYHLFGILPAAIVIQRVPNQNEDAKSYNKSTNEIAILNPMRNSFYPQASEVPPGRWRIKAFENLNGDSLNFCFGSPIFTVKPGKVVYIGDYDLDGPTIGPDMRLEPLKAWLGDNFTRVSEIEPADFQNGSMGACNGPAVYALEIQGAPYVDGYTWGGAGLAKATTSTLTAPQSTSQAAAVGVQAPVQ